MSFDAPQTPTPIMPTMVEAGKPKGSRPKPKSTTPTFLGEESSATASGFAPGKTLLGS